MNLRPVSAISLRADNFGPEYMFPANCVSDSANVSRIWHEEAKANAMIAEAEDILFPAQREHSQVAIVYPRSSEMWDEWHTELAAGMCMCCCVSSMVSRYIEYTVEACKCRRSLCVFFRRKPKDAAAQTACTSRWRRTPTSLSTSS